MEFDKKPTTKDLLLTRIFTDNESLVHSEFNANNISVDYRTGTVTLKPTNSKIYDEEPFSF
jgi:hypothetical protein